MVSPQQITILLEEWSEGNEAALNELIPLVEAELHRLARQYISREHRGHTLWDPLESTCRHASLSIL